MSRLSTDHGKSDEQYAVMLPCSQSDFASFIANLIGKGQTISARVDGAFSIAKDHLINLHHLIDQRVMQQNEASLLQVTVKFITKTYLPFN